MATTEPYGSRAPSPHVPRSLPYGADDAACRSEHGGMPSLESVDLRRQKRRAPILSAGGILCPRESDLDAYTDDDADDVWMTRTRCAHRCLRRSAAIVVFILLAITIGCAIGIVVHVMRTDPAMSLHPHGVCTAKLVVDDAVGVIPSPPPPLPSFPSPPLVPVPAATPPTPVTLPVVHVPSIAGTPAK